MTALTKKVNRVSAVKVGKRAVVVTIAPAGAQAESLIGFRLQGTRTTYVCAVSSLYRVAAEWHGNKEKQAKRIARALGVPWRVARRQFNRENSL